MKKLTALILALSMAIPLRSAVRLNGSSSYIGLNAWSLNQNEGSVSVWILDEESISTGDAPYFRASTATPWLFDIYNYIGELIVGWYKPTNDDRTHIAMSDTGIVSGRWFHLCATWVSGGSTNVYVNGIYVGSNSGSTDATWDIGSATLNGFGWGVAAGSPASYFTGSLDDIQWYDRVLSLSEIQTLAMTRRRGPVFTDGLRQYLPADEIDPGFPAVGTHAMRDRSGNGRTGDAQSGVTYVPSILNYW